jgi:uncharacterized Zn finger protein
MILGMSIEEKRDSVCSLKRKSVDGAAIYTIGDNLTIGIYALISVSMKSRHVNNSRQSKNHKDII